jgi:hypothetical protein
MKRKWFTPMGWIYRPIQPEGFLVTALAILFMIPVCLSVVRNGHSVSDDLYHIFVYGTCNAFWWKWVAEKTSA